MPHRRPIRSAPGSAPSPSRARRDPSKPKRHSQGRAGKPGGPARTDRRKQTPRRDDVPSIYRVIFGVPGIDDAAAFYAKFLRQRGKRVSLGRHYFTCGSVILALVDPRADGDAYDAAPTPEWTYFRVNDLDGWHARADKAKFARLDVAPARRPWGERSFYAVDPWGNKLCFVESGTVFRG